MKLPWVILAGAALFLMSRSKAVPVPTSSGYSPSQSTNDPNAMPLPLTIDMGSGRTFTFDQYLNFAMIQGNSYDQALKLTQIAFENVAYENRPHVTAEEFAKQFDSNLGWSTSNTSTIFQSNQTITPPYITQQLAPLKAVADQYLRPWG